MTTDVRTEYARTAEMQDATEDRQGGQRELVTGGVLIGAGALILLAQWIEIGLLVLPALAMIFAVAGIITRSAGWFIPAGILGGIGLGAAAEELTPYFGDAEVEGGLFLLSFALGWVAVYALSRIFTLSPQRWALIPAGILALIGVAVVSGEVGRMWLGLTFSVANFVWPAVLVGIGAWIVIRSLRQPGQNRN